MVQITERHIKFLEKWQKVYRFSASVEKEDSLRAGFIEDLVTASEILDYLVETGMKSQGDTTTPVAIELSGAGKNLRITGNGTGCRSNGTTGNNKPPGGSVETLQGNRNGTASNREMEPSETRGENHDETRTVI